MSLRAKLELSAIFIVAASLVISLISLGTKAATAASAKDIEDKFPSLYAGNNVEIVEPPQKKAYLTFDDGPSINTERILDVLKAENVKATFFVCAQCAESIDVPAVLRRILDEGHEIGLHSYMHDYDKVYRSLHDYLDDLNKINDYIFEATGYRPSILRFPGGRTNTKSSKSLMKEIIAEVTRRGYKYYDWNIDSGDSTSHVNSVDYLYNRIVKDTKDKEMAIILMHDSPGPKTTPDALKRVIPALREQGYIFDILTQDVEFNQPL